MEDIAVKIDGVTKSFVLPHQQAGSLKDVFTSVLNRNRRYEKQTALKNIDLEIKKGEFFGIVGRNGSGKSTLLKIIAEIYQPTNGNVKINGKLVPFIELGVGFSPELSGRDNVYLNGAMLGFSRRQVADKYNRIVEFAELERFMDQKLKNYSSGMQVRLAFSVATILAESDILLIDEVLAVGDADFQRKCFSYFKTLKREKKTVVFVSHDMGAVREYCDRAILIDNSKIVIAGDPEKVGAAYAKLFAVDTAHASSVSEQPNRWGDGSVKTKSISVHDITEKDKKFRAKFNMEALEDVEDVNFGYQIKSESGQPVLGNNTSIALGKKFTLSKGERVSVTWEIPNLFEDGRYFIEPTIAYGGGVVADWWELAETFVSRRQRKTPYTVSPDTKCEVDIS